MKTCKQGALALPPSSSPRCAGNIAFLVETTPESERDAEAILEWLFSQHAGDTGIRWFLALEDAIASLAISPARCPLAPEDAESPFEVRHLLYGRRPHVYRVLFTIKGDTVTILHIRHGRRQAVSPH
ncbi:MAG: type II toxin-antitoxin system RelE/ParE family toxin [Bryobacteraceae bacterium]|jgi:plasmid stabilization system protein ParE